MAVCASAGSNNSSICRDEAGAKRRVDEAGAAEGPGEARCAERDARDPSRECDTQRNEVGASLSETCSHVCLTRQSYSPTRTLSHPTLTYDLARRADADAAGGSGKEGARGGAAAGDIVCGLRN